jgi:hypothetical protein
MLTAQQAATGAKTCTVSAASRIGKNFRNRRRIDDSTLFDGHDLIMQLSHCRDLDSGLPPYRCLPAGNYSVTWIFSASFLPQGPIQADVAQSSCRNPDHFVNCPKFDHSLLKMVTTRTKWSTSAASGWPRGSSLVVQVSGGALTRTSSVASSIKIKSNFFGEIGSTQFLEQGSRPALFFFFVFCSKYFRVKSSL